MTTKADPKTSLNLERTTADFFCFSVYANPRGAPYQLYICRRGCNFFSHRKKSIQRHISKNHSQGMNTIILPPLLILRRMPGREQINNK